MKDTSVKSKILTYLLTGRKISALQCLTWWHDMRLAAHICELRKIYTIGDVWVKRNGKKFKRYFLN